MGIPLAGKQGRVQIRAGGFGGVAAAGATYNVNMDRWKVTPKSNDIPTTNFEDMDAFGNLFTSGITGALEADVEFNGWYDTGVPVVAPGNGAGPIFVAPLFLVPGVYGLNGSFATPAFRLFHQKSLATSCFIFPSLRLLQTPMDVDVNGRVNLAVAGKSNGPYTFPST